MASQKSLDESLDEIKRLAKIRHEKERKAARRRGRKDFPMLPYECSWAFEEEYRRKHRQNPPPVQRTKIPWVAVAAGLLGIIWLRNWKKVPLNKVPYGARVEYAMQPTQGKANQLASIQTYRLIANRRSGMTYTPVTEEKADKTLIFTVPVDGTVTRNVVVEGSRKYVEIATA